MSFLNDKPKGIKKRRGAPKIASNERKAYIHISISNGTLNTLDALTDNRSSFIERAILDKLSKEDFSNANNA